MRTVLLPGLFLALLLAPAAHAREVKSVANPRDKGAWVTDEVGLLTPAERGELDRVLAETERGTSAEVAVVLLHTVGDKVPKDFAVELFHAWGIGKKGRDNGLLFLLVRDQRRVEVETGYGLEGLLPDARVAQILRYEVVQNLKEGRPGPAVVNGVKALVRTIERGETLPPEAPPRFEGLETWLFVYSTPLLAALALLLRVLWVLTRQKDLARRSEQLGAAAWIFGLPALLLGTAITAMAELSLGAGGVVLGAGGLVLFGLRKWAESFRYRARPCRKCGQAMSRIQDPAEEYRYFNDAQAWEEKLESRDFDVWLCGCGEKRIDEYGGRKSGKFRACKRCGTRVSFLKEATVLRMATYESGGEELRLWHCQACRRTDEEKIATPRLTRSSSSSGGSGGSSGSSSGSFGGGRSGGGGAGASW